MADDDEIDVEFTPEGYPDTLSGPDGEAHFGIDAQSFLEHWLAKLGIEVEGGALLIGEGPSLLIVHPVSGEFLTPAEIAKRSQATGNVRRIQ